MYVFAASQGRTDLSNLTLGTSEKLSGTRRLQKPLCGHSKSFSWAKLSVYSLGDLILKGFWIIFVVCSAFFLAVLDRLSLQICTNYAVLSLISEGKNLPRPTVLTKTD